MDGVTIRLVNFSGVGERVHSFALAGETNLFDLLNDWGAQNEPKLLKRLFYPELGSIAGTILILLNGRSVKSEDPKTTLVSPGDEITIAPILLGG